MTPKTLLKTERPRRPMHDPNHASKWQRWLHHPETFLVRRGGFQVHLWVGMIASLYIFVMSVTGSVIVYRKQLDALGKSSPGVARAAEWLVNLHTNLLFGMRGRLLNGVGAIGLTALCLTGAVLWWPGIDHWRRSLVVNWKMNFGRLNFDIHSALGFWCFLFVLVWAISGIYFAMPRAFNTILCRIDPNDHYADQALSWLANLHFGRFNRFTEALWSAVGLVPAALAFTGMFMCCHRLLYKSAFHPASARQASAAEVSQQAPR